MGCALSVVTAWTYGVPRPPHTCAVPRRTHTYIHSHTTPARRLSWDMAKVTPLIILIYHPFSALARRRATEIDSVDSTDDSSQYTEYSQYR